MSIDRLGVCTCDHHEDRHGPEGCLLCACSTYRSRRPPGSHVNAAGRPKTRYPSQRIAKQIAKAMPTKMHAYACEECYGWHLSSGPRRSDP